MLWSHPPLETESCWFSLCSTRPPAITSVWNLLINSDLWPGTRSFSVTAQREVSWKTNYLPQMPNSAHSAASWICSEWILKYGSNLGFGEWYVFGYQNYFFCCSLCSLGLPNIFKSINKKWNLCFHKRKTKKFSVLFTPLCFYSPREWRYTVETI